MTSMANDGANGVQRLGGAFARCRAEERAALITFLAAGDPDLDTTGLAVRAAVDAGADIIELGIPFSDPLADGPVIQQAYTRALAAGFTVDALLARIGRIVRDTDAPMVLMTSYNPVLAYGVERFCRVAARAGAAALLIPDLLPEDAHEVRTHAHGHGLATVFLVSPDSTDPRIAAASAASTGFVYLLSRRGITGTHDGIGSAVEGAVARVRRHAAVPVGVGFGISGAADARRVAAFCDGVIVGSALVRLLHDEFERQRSTGGDAEQCRRRACAVLRAAVSELALAVQRTGAQGTDDRPRVDEREDSARAVRNA